jgi:uncharacterized membrane protein
MLLVNRDLWRRAAVGAAAGAIGYAGARLVSRAILSDGDDIRTYRRGITIYRPPGEVYAFWRDLPSLARAVEHVIRVDEIGEQRTRWIIEGPGSSEIEFVAEVVIDEPDRVLAWRTEDSAVPHEGRVEFTPAPGARGTEVRVEMTYLPPAGDLGATVARLTGHEPDQLLRDALRRVKQVMEAGEVIVADGQRPGRDPIRERLAGLVLHRVAAGGRA